jgi:hypothetical protein
VVEVRPVREGDAEALAAALRQADLDELEAVRGPGDVAEAIRHALRDSALCWAAEADGELMCLFGVAPLTALGDIGVPWMLGTPVVDRNGRALTRLARAYIARMLEAFPTLANGVDARNVKAVRWIGVCGFTIMPPQPAGPAGMPFHPFVMKA